MAGLRDVLQELAERMDQRLPAGLYVAVSVPTGAYRERLRRQRRVFVDPAVAEVAMHDVDATAAWLVRQASLTSASVGGFASFAGAATVPPEAVAQAIAVLRLAQRLAIVYGFDPETSTGELAVWKALAIGLELTLPGDGPMQVRMRDIPGMLLPTRKDSTGAELAGAVIRRTTWMLASRMIRFIPLVSPAISAVSAHRSARDVGGRMQEALRRQVELPNGAGVEDAEEVP